MQPYIFRYSSIIGIEISIIPLEQTSSRTLLIPPVIVCSESNHILSTKIQKRSQIKAYRHHPIFMQSYMLAVQIEIRRLPYSLKLNKDLLPFCSLREPEMFSIPGYSIRHSPYMYFKCLIFIKSPGQSNFFPVFIGKIRSFRPRRISDIKQPSRVEIIFLTVIALSGYGKKQKHT